MRLQKYNAKKFIFFILIFIVFKFYTYGQLSGYWVENYRSLLNGEDGSKYTFDNKPLQPMFQFHFFKETNNIEFHDGYNNISGHYNIHRDTINIEYKIQFSGFIKIKYVIKTISDSKLILYEYKPNLDSSYFVRVFHFQKADSLSSKNIIHDEVYEITDSPPIFIGGQNELIKFLGKNIKHKKKRRGEIVIIKLIIDEDGNLSNAEILGNPHLEILYEAIRVCKVMPKWEAAKINHKPVKAYYTLPLKF